MTAFTLKRIDGRVVMVPTPSTTVDIVYLGQLDPVGLVADADETFWCNSTDGCLEGVALKRISAAQLADYTIARGGGVGGGGVSIAAGTGIGATPNPITGSGSIYLTNTGVIAGGYTNANIFVDAQGRITSAASGTGGGGGPTTLGGDVTGASAANTVVKLQNRPVSPTAPLDGQMLAWTSGSGGQWQPTPPPTPGGTGAPPGGGTGAWQFNSGGGNFGGIAMSGDATWSTSTGILTIAANAVNTAEIANGAVTYAKIQSVTGARLLGTPGATGPMSEILLGSNLSFSGGNTLNATGSGSGTVASAGINQVAWYQAAGTTVVGHPAVTLGTAGSMTINRAASLPPAAALATPVFWGVGNTTENPTLLLDGIGAQGAVILRRANGVGTTAVGSGDPIGQVAIRGYYSGATPGYSSVGNARLLFSALQTFTDVAQGTKIELQTTPLGGTSIATRIIIGPGVQVCDGSGNPPLGGDLGPGTVNVASGFFINNNAVSAGGGTLPGGSNTQVQFNSGGTAFGGSAGATFGTTSLTSMNIALGSDGPSDMYYRNASGNLTRFGLGVSASFLQASGGVPTWVAMSGDASLAAGGALTIGAGRVTLAQMENRTASVLVGRGSSGAGTPQEITLGTNLTMSGTQLNAGAAGGGVTSSPAGQIPWYQSTGATVVGHARITADSAGGLFLNRNAAANPLALVSGFSMWLGGADNGTPIAAIDAYGAAASAIWLRHAQGTGAAPTAIVPGDLLGGISWRGWATGASDFTPGCARFQAYSIEPGNFSSTAQGTALQLHTVPVNSTSLTLQCIFGPGLTVGIPAAQPSPVAGDINCVRLFVGGLPITPGPAADTTAIVSAAGTTQGTATIIGTQFANVTTVASGAGVVLPASPAAGSHVLVRNSGANQLLVYPAGTNQINTLGASVAISVLPNSTAYFEAASTAQWFTVP